MLPSCLTKRLWEGPERIARTVLSEESKIAAHGTLAVRGKQIAWRSADGSVRLATPIGPEADRVLLLLAHREYAEVRDAEIEVALTYVDGERVGHQSQLDLQFRSEGGEVAHVVSVDTLNEAALAGLSAGVFGNDRIPEPFRELLLQLPWLNLGAATGLRWECSLEGQVLLKPDGTPAFTEPLPANADPGPISTAERLEFLRQASVLLKLQGPEGPLYVRADADRLWLASRFGSFGSGWNDLSVELEFVGPERVEPSVRDDYAVPAEYVHRVAEYERVVTGGEDSTVLTKIALTPITLVFDIALGFLGSALGINDDDDDEEEEGRRKASRGRDNGDLDGIMSRARQRRDGETEAEWRARENGRMKSGGR